MTLTVMPLALVRVYRSTAWPSAVWPKSDFFRPALIVFPPFGASAAASPARAVSRAAAANNREVMNGVLGERGGEGVSVHASADRTAARSFSSPVLAMA